MSETYKPMRKMEWCFSAIPDAARRQLRIVATVSYDSKIMRYWISDQASGRAWWADFEGGGYFDWEFTEVGV